jgi:tetratricopeptide (TPR) repeat protein
MTQSTPLRIALGRFKQLPQRSNEVWQGGLVRLPAWIDNKDDPLGPPYRPTGALWVSLRSGLVHMALPTEDVPAVPELAVKALLDFGLKHSNTLNGRPSTIEVRDPLLKQALDETLSGLSTSVVSVEELPAVDEVLRNLEASASGGRRHAGMLEGTRVTVDQVRAFADAAAAFFRAEPWRHLTNEDLIAVKAPRVPKGMRHICMLGNAGQQFGLAFFESRAAFEQMYSAAGSRPPRRAFGVTFGPIDDLPFADVDAWEDLQLPVVNARAYPLAADLGSDGTMRRFTADELAAAEALLRALARTTEDELDSGSWRRTVPTCAGEMNLEFTLPLLIDQEQGKPVGPALGMMPRLAERGSMRLARLFESRSFESLDEANAAVDRASADGLFEMSAEQAAGRSLTALERAQELAYDAMEATGRLKIKLARRALTVSEDCADAYVILGETMATPEDACVWYQRGVDAGVRALGADKFAALTGEFWGHLETRPYMRARLALAQSLHELGQQDEALDHYRELVRLNPNDNQGVRYLLLPALLEDGREEEADQLLADYDGDMQAIWPYAQALRTFRASGDGERTRSALTRALRANPHVVGYLLEPETIPPDSPPHFALGSKEEAAYVAEGLRAAFDITPGALTWLAVNSRRSKVRRFGRSRGQSRRR